MYLSKRCQLLILVATILGSSIVTMDGTIVNLALPKIATNLHAGFSALQWIVDGYILSLSALILLGGSLGDILGRKKVYVTGLIGFAAGSLLCALAPNATMLIVFRIIQGVFGALLVPGALSIIQTTFPPEARGKAIGRWTGWGTIAVVAGPLLGGLILDVASWRWIFLINIPFVAACLWLIFAALPESRAATDRHVDGVGAGLAALSLAGITYGLIQGPAQHWSVIPIVSLATGLLVTVGFVVFEARSRDPMVPLRLFKSRNFSGSNLMTFAMYGALSGFVFSLTIYIQTHLHYSSLKAGFTLLPSSILMFFFAGKAGAQAAKHGPRLFMTFGPLLSAVGIVLLYFLQPGDAYLTGLLPGTLLFAAGLVLTVAPLTTTVMAAVSDKQSGIASGINNAVSRAAGLIVVAALGLLGAAREYHFAMVLCAVLAAMAGIISFVIIDNRQVIRR